MTHPTLSVVIPTRDGAATLPALLDALWRQRLRHDLDIVAVDSGSTDGTIDLLEGRVSEVVRIAPEEFNHGLTRNLAIGRTRGDVVVLLVQDAIPQGEDFLTSLTAPLVRDESLAGTFARQVPRADASRLAREMLSRWVAAAAEPRVSGPIDTAAFQQMSPQERLTACAFDNVASAIRRTVWTRHPFRRTPIAEDLEWGREVLLAGHRIAFVPDAVVVHSHDRSVRHEYRRTYELHARLAELFDLRTIPSASALEVALLVTIAGHLRAGADSPYWWPRALALAVAWPLAQYRGAKGRTMSLEPAM